MSKQPAGNGDRLSEGKALLEGAMQGAFSLFGGGPASTGSSGNGPKSEISATDIPKEELMALCMKMNKRMQVLESKNQELTKKKNSLTDERKYLLELIAAVTPVPIPPSEDRPIDSAAIRQAWLAWEEQQRKKIASSEQAQLEFERNFQRQKASLDTLHRKEITELTSKLQASGSKVASLVVEQSSSSSVPENLLPGANLVESNENATLLLNNQRLQSLVDDLETQCRSLASNEERSQQTIENLRTRLQSSETGISDLTLQLDGLKKELEDSKNKREEAVLYSQMQLNSFKSKEESRDKETVALKKQIESQQAQITSLHQLVEEKDMSVKSNRGMIQALQHRLVEVEPELEKARAKTKDLEKNLTAAAVLKAEQEALLANMRKDLKNALDAKDESIKRARELEEFRLKSENQSARITALTDQVETLQSSVEDKTSLITRLRSEAQANERNHAMRAALLATCEAEIDSLKSEMTLKTETTNEALSRVKVLQERLASAENKLLAKTEEMESKLQAAAAEAAANSARHEEDLQRLTEQHELAMEVLKRDHSKKSSVARIMLSEKEEENRVLTAKVADLQAEIASGAPSERKIFELANQQAKRDALYGSHNDSREIAFVQLQMAIASKDLQLAELQQRHAALVAEVADLRRSSRRESVNMDYLKNIVLQYMTFPVAAPERASLVPVIAMLLQFNPKEMAEIEKSSKESAWGSRPVIEVRRSLNRANSSGSLEKKPSN